MNNERLLMKGVLSELRKDVQKYELIAQDEIMVIRSTTNPLTHNDIRDMNLHAAQASLSRLADAQAKIGEFRAKITKIEKELE